MSDLSSLKSILGNILTLSDFQRTSTLSAFEHGCNAIADDYSDILQKVADSIGITKDQAKTLLKGLGDIAHSAARGGIF